MTSTAIRKGFGSPIPTESGPVKGSSIDSYNSTTGKDVGEGVMVGVWVGESGLVGEKVGVAVDVGVFVDVAVRDGVTVLVEVRVAVLVAVALGEGLVDGVSVSVGNFVAVSSVIPGVGDRFVGEGEDGIGCIGVGVFVLFTGRIVEFNGGSGGRFTSMGKKATAWLSALTLAPNAKRTNIPIIMLIRRRALFPRFHPSRINKQKKNTMLIILYRFLVVKSRYSHMVVKRDFP